MSVWIRSCGCAGWRRSASSPPFSSWCRGSNSTSRWFPASPLSACPALLNLVLQITFNPMQRLEPVYAAALLALNIVELAGAVVFHRRIAEPVFIPVSGPGPDFGHRAADPADDRARGSRRGVRLGAGVFLSAAAVGRRGTAGAAADLSVRRLALDRARDRGDEPLCVPGHGRSPQIVRRVGRDRTGADPRAASDAIGWSGGRRRARARHAAVDDFPDLARTGAGAEGQPGACRRHQDACASRRSAAATSWPRSRSSPRPARRSTACRSRR